jgi:DNA mismatch endonuclease (patch repair protein)
MADVFTAEKRALVMSAIRSRGNQSTEVRLAQLLRLNRITGWRRNLALPGRPDFAFRKERVAVFVDGCFWHGCPKHFKRPKSSRKFWDEKIARNKARDAKVGRELRKLGWKVLRIWEHALSRREAVKSLRRVERALSRSR